MYVVTYTSNIIYKYSGGTFSSWASGSPLSSPLGICFDWSQNLYVGNGGNTIVMYTPSKVSYTIVTISGASFRQVLVGPDSQLYSADEGTGTIRKHYIAGGTSQVNSVVVTTAIAVVHCMVFDNNNVLWAASESNSIIYKVTNNGATVTAFSSAIANPLGLVFDSAGILYATSLTGNYVASLTSSGGISSFVVSNIASPYLTKIDSTNSQIVVPASNSNGIYKIGITSLSCTITAPTNG